MTLQSNGVISMNDIKAEFGGDAPDGIEEYYRNGDLVTGNNTNVPECATADCPINFEQFYDGELIYSKSVPSNVQELVLSELFTNEEWASTTPKEVVVETGITVGSNSVGTVACRTGILNAISQPMGGTLRLVVNGFIYGAGGAAGLTGAGGVGGNALHAEILLTVINNSRIYGGGGGGGKGGRGAYVRYYPETTAWRYNNAWGTCPAYRLSTKDVGYVWYISRPDYDDGFLVMTFNGISWFNCDLGECTTGITGTIQISGSYRYERGALRDSCYLYSHSGIDWGYWLHEIRRSIDGIITGGNPGNGGQGIGSNGQTNTVGVNGTKFTNGTYGGKGGDGGYWGADGVTGNHGDGPNLTYQITTTVEGVGWGHGLGGYYIVGDGNVTWEVPGLRLGRVG